jgi:hypothetical protein
MAVTKEFLFKVESQINRHDFSVRVVEILERDVLTLHTNCTEIRAVIRSRIDDHMCVFTMEFEKVCKDKEIAIAEMFMFRALQHDEECDCDGTFQLHHKNQSEDNKRIIKEMGKLAA